MSSSGKGTFFSFSEKAVWVGLMKTTAYWKSLGDLSHKKSNFFASSLKPSVPDAEWFCVRASVYQFIFNRNHCKADIGAQLTNP